jgi:hypothetical protein
VPDSRFPIIDTNAGENGLKHAQKRSRGVNRGFAFLKVSGVEEGGGEPSSGSTPDKKGSDTYPAPEPSSAHLGSADRLGQQASMENITRLHLIFKPLN